MVENLDDSRFSAPVTAEHNAEYSLRFLREDACQKTGSSVRAMVIIIGTVRGEQVLFP
jgi:hypothetical protein